jgi:sugar phosphate isomerase/epimerase
LIATLSELGAYGQKVGAVLAARTGAEPGGLLAKLIDALPPGAIGVDFDPAELIVRGHSVREALTALAGNVVHVHAKDAVRDLASNRGLETPLGRGSVDFAELLGALDEQQFRGYFTIERIGAADPVGELRQAVQYLKAL